MYKLIALSILTVVLLCIGGYAALQYLHTSPTGIGVTQIANESIGISDGSYAFDIRLADSDVLTNASPYFFHSGGKWTDCLWPRWQPD